MMLKTFVKLYLLMLLVVSQASISIVCWQFADEKPSSLMTKRNQQPLTTIPSDSKSNQVHFPQQHTQILPVKPKTTASSFLEATRWQYPESFKRDQEDKIDLNRYMKNYFEGYDSFNQALLNLADINDRAIKSVQPRPSGTQNPALIKEKSDITGLSSPINRPISPESNVIKSRVDLPSIQMGESYDRKGKVDDVALFKPGLSKTLAFHPPSPMRQVVHQVSDKPNLLTHMMPRNCITESTWLIATCEDHLIKRLNQDASEGRTVKDVERRVCCALFWHKDCIHRVVLETCPDSSPAAADYLLGSRKLDLTLSCRQYNRDGCNSAVSLSVSIHQVVSLCLFYVIINAFI